MTVSSNTHLITISLIHVLARVLLLSIRLDSVRVLNNSLSTLSWPNDLRNQIGERRVDGKILFGHRYFYFTFAVCSSQLAGAHANEIKHDHSAVVYVVLDSICD